MSGAGHSLKNNDNNYVLVTVDRISYLGFWVYVMLKSIRIFPTSRTWITNATVGISGLANYWI
ncbi:hypothetical protein C5167_041620 [Papaver somniferum]|nr:hypothetical protein C5167_041620 [Papaver somniferum]